MLKGCKTILCNNDTPMQHWPQLYDNWPDWFGEDNPSVDKSL